MKVNMPGMNPAQGVALTEGAGGVQVIVRTIAGVTGFIRFSALSAAITASPISRVPTSFFPGCMMSPVRKPSSSTRSTARSTSLASSNLANE